MAWMAAWLTDRIRQDEAPWPYRPFKGVDLLEDDFDAWALDMLARDSRPPDQRVIEKQKRAEHLERLAERNFREAEARRQRQREAWERSEELRRQEEEAWRIVHAEEVRLAEEKRQEQVRLWQEQVRRQQEEFRRRQEEYERAHPMLVNGVPFKVWRAEWEKKWGMKYPA